MKILIDTSIFLKLMTEPDELSEQIVSECKDIHNDLFISVVSLWEMEIKTHLAKLQFNIPMNQIIKGQIDSGYFKILELTLDHLKGLNNVPFHHNDPFDRMLISQAIKENMVIATENKQFAFYNEEIKLI